MNLRDTHDAYRRAVEQTRHASSQQASDKASDVMIDLRHQLDAAFVGVAENVYAGAIEARDGASQGIDDGRGARSAGASDTDLRACLDPENPRHLLNITEKRGVAEEWWSDVGSTTKAGYTVPVTVLERVVYHINAESGAFGPAYKFNTSTGEDVTVPILATDAVANLTAEKTASTITDPVFGVETLKSYRLDGHFVLSDELLRDSAVGIQRVVGDAAGRALATKLAGYLAIGTGSGEPEGVTVGAAAGVVAAGTTTVAFDEVKQLVYSVLKGARKNGVFVGSSDLTVLLALTKDDNDDYVWQPANAMDQPDRLFGKPYYEDAAFPSMAAGNVPLVFGDLGNYYWVRMVNRAQNGGGIQLDFSQDAGFTSFCTYARFAMWVDARVMGTGGEIKKLTMHA